MCHHVGNTSSKSRGCKKLIGAFTINYQLLKTFTDNYQLLKTFTDNYQLIGNF